MQKRNKENREWPINLYFAVFYGNCKKQEGKELSKEDIRKVIEPMIEELPESSREILCLRYKEHNALKTIAIEKGISVQAVYERTITAKNRLIENGIYERFGKTGRDSGRREMIIKNLGWTPKYNNGVTRRAKRFCPWPESLFVGIAKSILKTGETQIIIRNMPNDFYETYNAIWKTLPEDVRRILESKYRSGGDKTGKGEQLSKCKKKSEKEKQEEVYAVTCFINAYNAKSDTQLSMAFMNISQEIVNYLKQHPKGGITDIA